jgi:hypothetical protein
MNPKLNIVFEIFGEDSEDLVIDELMSNLSKALGIKTEILDGDISTRERLTIPLKDGRKLIIQGEDADEYFVAIENK